jgi:hypothetical protein
MKVKIHLVEYKFLSIPFSLLLFSSYGPGREEEKENKSIYHLKDFVASTTYCYDWQRPLVTTKEKCRRQSISLN